MELKTCWIAHKGQQKKKVQVFESDCFIALEGCSLLTTTDCGFDRRSQWCHVEPPPPPRWENDWIVTIVAAVKGQSRKVTFVREPISWIQMARNRPIFYSRFPSKLHPKRPFSKVRFSSPLQSKWIASASAAAAAVAVEPWLMSAISTNKFSTWVHSIMLTRRGEELWGGGGTEMTEEEQGCILHLRHCRQHS